MDERTTKFRMNSFKGRDFLYNKNEHRTPKFDSGTERFFQKQKIRVDIKRSTEEHTTRLGHIVGPVVDRINMGWSKETTNT